MTNSTSITIPIDIYADGACKGNADGGWGYLIIYNFERIVEGYGGERNTTNNRMEMMAVIEALSAVEGIGPVTVFSDSQYVKDGITKWIKGWKRNGWKTAAKTDVKNKDLWIQLDSLTLMRKIEWKWVKGHSGDPGNERADVLANKGVDQLRYGA